MNLRDVEIPHLRNRIQVEVAAMREQVVQLTATHDELHEILIVQVNLEGQKRDQLRNVIFDVVAGYGTFHWVQPFAFQALEDVVMIMLALLVQLM